MVLNGWEYSTLESLCEPNAPITYGVLKPGDYFADGVPLLQIKDLLSDLSEPQYLHRISPELDEQYKRSKIKTNDILISLVGTVGRIGIVPEQLNNANIHRNLGRIRTKSFEFLVHYLDSDIAKNRFGTSSSGSSQSALNLTVLRALKVPVPPFQEQQKIAEILSTWDKAISTTERLIDNSTQQKKALMQQLLTGKKRLIDESGKRFEGEWEEVTIGSLGKIYSGGTPSTSNKKYWDGDIDWVTPTDITKQSSLYINSSLRKITQEGLKNSSAKLVPKGSLLVCTRATIGEMTITSHEMCTNQGFKNIIPNKKTNIEFVYYLLTYYKHKLFSQASGSTFLELSKTSFESMKFRVPIIAEQQKIATVLTNADKEIELLEQQLADFQQEKKALMQQLLTGKRRVVV